MATATASSSTSSPAAASGAQGSADTMAGDVQAQAPSSAAAAEPGGDDHRSSDRLRAERRRSNQLEKEILTLRQQLNRFFEINPEEYARRQQAERQKQILEQQMELHERQREPASAQKVAAVAAERDEAGRPAASSPTAPQRFWAPEGEQGECG